jgi:hypothetical protein
VFIPHPRLVGVLLDRWFITLLRSLRTTALQKIFEHLFRHADAAVAAANPVACQPTRLHQAVDSREAHLETPRDFTNGEHDASDILASLAREGRLRFRSRPSSCFVPKLADMPMRCLPGLAAGRPLLPVTSVLAMLAFAGIISPFWKKSTS